MIESNRVASDRPSRGPRHAAAAAAVALGVGAIAAWMTLVRDRSHAPAPKPTRTMIEVPLRPLVAAFPDGTPADEAPCAGGAGRVPLVTLSAIAGAPVPLEQELFPDAAPPTGSVLADDGRVAILRSIADDEGEGRYDGRIVVFDGATRRALCHTRVQVSSRGNLRWTNVSPRGLHSAHVESVRRGVLEAGERLKVELRI